MFTVVLAVLSASKGNRFQPTSLIPADQVGRQRLHSTEDVTQNNFDISNVKEMSIRTMSQDVVQVELPPQNFEVYKINLENLLLWKIKTWVGLGRGGQGFGD